MSAVNNQRVFTPNPVINLEDNDFELDGPVKIMLKNKNCSIVLFYADNKESLNLADVWQSVGQQGVAGVFAGCNLRLNPKVAQAFNDLNSKNTSVHWAALKTIPYILVYQNGFPVAFYNGERSVGPILDYSLTLACRSDYREYANLYGGIQAEDNIGIKGNEQYGSSANPDRKQSSEYVSTKPIRTYPPTDVPQKVSLASESTTPENTTPEITPTETRVLPTVAQ
jgi:hypothetical protein